MNTMLTYCLGFEHCTGMQMREDIIDQANFLAGGCTVTFSDGYWMDGAQDTKQVYHGKALTELCMKIEMLVPTDRLEFVMKWMRRGIIVALRCDHEDSHENQKQVDMDWVQVTTQRVDTHHFAPTEDL